MSKEKIDRIRVNIKLKMLLVPYKKRKISLELENFCAECEERLSQLSNVLGGYPEGINVGYWFEAPLIDEERKIYIQRKNKYSLHVDWSECDKKVIEKGAIPEHPLGWINLPSFIERLFGDEFFDATEKLPTYRSLGNGCSVSFSKLKCRDAIFWANLPHQMTTDQDINLNTVKGSYQSIGMSDVADELFCFAAHVRSLEVSMNTKTCMGLWNLPFLRSEASHICGRDAKYRADKGYYLCEGCGQAHQEMFGKISKIR
jgi:hypothetical protein